MVVDTGARLNLVHTDILPGGWTDRVFYGPQLSIRATNGKTLKTRGEIKTLIKLSGCIVPATFVVSDELPVPMLLGTSFTNKHIRSIQCVDRVVVTRNGDVLPLLKDDYPSIEPCTKPPILQRMKRE